VSESRTASASHDGSEPLVQGLYALKGLRGGRTFSVLVIAVMVVLQAGFTAALVMTIIADARSSCSNTSDAVWWVGSVWFVYGVVTGNVARYYAWRLALIKRRLPIVELRRDADGLAMVSRRFWGFHRGRSRSTEVTVRSGEKRPMTIARGDEVTVTLRKLWPTYSRADRLYRLTVASPRGYFRVTVPLGASLLDFEAFDASLRAGGASVTFPRLDD
jgi:hypothetical protein